MATRTFYMLKGQNVSLQELADLAGIQKNTMWHRLQTKTPEQALAMVTKPRNENWIGRTFGDGQLTVESEAGRSPSNKRVWNCRCKCGTVKAIIGADLKSGRTVSCGCVFARKASERATARAEDITGQTFADGAVRVLGLSDAIEEHRRGAGATHRHRLWRCCCACGNEFLAKASPLRQGQITSCGCGIVHRAKTKAASDARTERVTVYGREMLITELAELSGVSVPTLRYRMRTGGMTPDMAAFEKPVDERKSAAARGRRSATT